MKKILLLGAGGFIGSHLAVELLKTRRYQIKALDITKEKLDEGICQEVDVIHDVDESNNLSKKYKIEKTIKKITYIDLDIMQENNQQRLNNLIKNNDPVKGWRPEHRLLMQ